MLGYERVGHNPAFDHLKSLEGGADNGVALFYKYLDYRFPDSKFVLLWRTLDTWLPSVEFASRRFPLKSRNDDIPIMRRMMIYETVDYDRDKFVAAYHKHHADVRRYFANRPNDLLEMNIVDHQDGWEKLCPFLSLAAPACPFPHLHAQQGDGDQLAMFANTEIPR